MACQCLVVTAETLGIDELLTDGVHGWVVPPGAWELAAERAIHAFREPESARAMAAAAQTHVLEKFDLLRLMRAMVHKWEEHKAHPASSPTRAGASSYLPSGEETGAHKMLG
jgi:glycosyltransferase involved in cell wall biosynthesis